MALIEVHNLSKHFRAFRRREGVRGAFRDLFSRRWATVRAVDGISFALEAGESVGYIGPNGAGKSTTIKMLTGILTPTSGQIHVGGLVPTEDRERYVRGIGVVFGQRSQLWWDLAVIESYRLLGRIYGVPPEDFERRLTRFSDVLELGPLLHTPVRKLSLGQKMRCELAAALLHGPKVLFLDEPTIGLDVVAKSAIREFLRRMNDEEQVTLLLTTHDLRDIEALCRRVIIIHHGGILFDGPLERLRSKLGGRAELHFTLNDPLDVPSLLDLQVNGARWDEIRPGVVACQFDRERISRAEVIRTALSTAQVDDVAMQEVDIEQIVREIFHAPPENLS